MDWAAVLGIAAVLVIMVLYEWPQLKPQMKREKTAYAVLTAVGGLWLCCSCSIRKCRDQRKALMPCTNRW